MELKDKVAIVTGGASGIGESAVKLFVANGAKVVITDVNEEAGNALAEAVKKDGGEAIFVKADTSKPEDSEKSVEAALSAYGKLDIAVNNAGIGGGGSGQPAGGGAIGSGSPGGIYIRSYK